MHLKSRSNNLLYFVFYCSIKMEVRCSLKCSVRKALSKIGPLFLMQDFLLMFPVKKNSKIPSMKK